MDREEDPARQAVEQAHAITSLIDALADSPQAGPLAAEIASSASRARDALLTLDTRAEIMDHLDTLDSLLTLAVEECARSCRLLADRLAMIEEFRVAPAGGKTSSEAAGLATRLARTVA